jgi:hypothetical protein
VIGSALFLAAVVGAVVRRLWRCRRDPPRVVGPGLPPVTESGRRPLGEVVVTSVVVLDDDVLVGYCPARPSDLRNPSTGTLVLSGLAHRRAAVAALHHWREARTAVTGYLLDAGAALVDPLRGTVVATPRR